MTRPWQWLSSLKLATGILAVLGAWLAWGIFIADWGTYVSGLRAMNSALLFDWFAHPDISAILITWVLGLFFFMGVLGVNLVFCSWNHMAVYLRNPRSKRKILMLAVHALFGLVALGHLGSFVLGYRYENVKIEEDGTFSLPDGYFLMVTDIRFVDNPDVLKKRLWEMMSHEYHPRQNSVRVVLKHGKERVQSGNISYLNPLSYRDIQVTLKRFTPVEAKMGQEKGFLKPGVALAVTRNPAKRTVFALFPLMILGIAVYTGMTWRRPF